MRGRRSIVLRVSPALLTLVAAVAVVVTMGGPGIEEPGDGWDSAPPPVLAEPVSPLPCPDPAGGFDPDGVEALIALSERAAALTGSLALIEPGERPAQALEAAREAHELAARAADREGGTTLAAVLADLAAALEGYAGGDPGALGDVRAASARNAELREAWYRRRTICGGEQNE